MLTQPVDGLPWVEDAGLGYGAGGGVRFYMSAYVVGGGRPTEITASFFKDGSTQPALVLDDVRSVDDGSGTRFSSPTQVILPDLGRYRVAVDVHDNEGHFVHIDDVNDVRYMNIVNFTEFKTQAPTTLDYDHRTVTVSGKITVTDPRTHQTTPFTGATVRIVNTAATSTGDMGTATAGADGTFTATRTVNGNFQGQADYTPPASQADYYTSQVASDGNIAWASQDQVRIRFLTPANVNLPVGGHTLVKGVLERNAGGNWIPTPGVTFHFRNPGPWVGRQSGSGVTDANGQFSFTLSQAGSFVVENAMTPFLYWTQSDPVYIHIPQPDTISASVVSDAYGQVKIDGHLKLGDGTTRFEGSTVGVDVQYSADGRNWSTLGQTKIGRNSLAFDEFLCWAMPDHRTNSNGWWRVHFRGTADWRPATSRAVHINRIVTRITGGKPVTKKVRKNSTLTLNGSLQQSYGGHWHSFKGAKVRLLFRPTGSKTWYLMATRTVDRYGHYRISSKVSRSGTWSVAYLWADSHHLDSFGPATWVGLR